MELAQLVQALGQQLEVALDKSHAEVLVRIDSLQKQMDSHRQRLLQVERMVVSKQTVSTKSKTMHSSSTVHSPPSQQRSKPRKKAKTKPAPEMIGNIELDDAEPLTNRSSPFIHIKKMAHKSPVNTVWDKLFNSSTQIRFKSPQHVSAQIARLTAKHVNHIQTEFAAIAQDHLDYFEHTMDFTANSLYVKWDVKNVFVVQYLPQTSWSTWHYDMDGK